MIRETLNNKIFHKNKNLISFLAEIGKNLPVFLMISVLRPINLELSMFYEQ